MASRKPRHVVLIDDDEVTIYFAMRAIEQASCFDEVVPFTDPRDALLFFQNRRSVANRALDGNTAVEPSDAIDLLLLDFRMPHLNGLEFLAALKADHLDPLVKSVAVMLTIPLMPEDEDLFRTSGFNVVFLSKPLDGDALAEVAGS